MIKIQQRLIKANLNRIQFKSEESFIKSFFFETSKYLMQIMVILISYPIP